MFKLYYFTIEKLFFLYTNGIKCIRGGRVSQFFSFFAVSSPPSTSSFVLLNFEFSAARSLAQSSGYMCWRSGKVRRYEALRTIKASREWTFEITNTRRGAKEPVAVSQIWCNRLRGVKGSPCTVCVYLWQQHRPTGVCVPVEIFMVCLTSQKKGGKEFLCICNVPERAQRETAVTMRFNISLFLVREEQHKEEWFCDMDLFVIFEDKMRMRGSWLPDWRNRNETFSSIESRYQVHELIKKTFHVNNGWLGSDVVSTASIVIRRFPLHPTCQSSRKHRIYNENFISLAANCVTRYGHSGTLASFTLCEAREWELSENWIKLRIASLHWWRHGRPKVSNGFRVAHHLNWLVSRCSSWMFTINQHNWIDKLTKPTRGQLGQARQERIFYCCAN